MLKAQIKTIKNNGAMKVKLLALKMLMPCIAVGIIFIWMRAEGPATCLCDELCVSLHVAVALNLEGLPSARAAARAASLVIQYKVILLKSRLTWDHFWGTGGIFLSTFLFFFYPKSSVNCWSGQAARSQISLLRCPKSPWGPKHVLLWLIGVLFLNWPGLCELTYVPTQSHADGDLGRASGTCCWSLTFLSLLGSLP